MSNLSLLQSFICILMHLKCVKVPVWTLVAHVWVGFQPRPRILRLVFTFTWARKFVGRTRNGNKNRGFYSETPNQGCFTHVCVWTHCYFNALICSPDSLAYDELWLKRTFWPHLTMTSCPAGKTWIWMFEPVAVRPGLFHAKVVGREDTISSDSQNLHHVRWLTSGFDVQWDIKWEAH